MVLVTLKQIAEKIGLTDGCLKQRKNVNYRDLWPEPKKRHGMICYYDEAEVIQILKDNPFERGRLKRLPT